MEPIISSGREVRIETGNCVWNELYPRIKTILLNNTRTYFIDGAVVRGYTPSDGPSTLWLRDHTHNLKGFKYFEPDMQSFIGHMLRRQRTDGSFFDYFTPHTFKPNPFMGTVIDDSNRLIYARCGTEADVEYLAALAVHGIWQATGDEEWMDKQLEYLERGLQYSLTHPERWSTEYRLVKRPFTIDTWDFEYGEPHHFPNGAVYHRSQIDELTKFCVMHGDNSGMHEACRLLSEMCSHTGRNARAEHWKKWADHFRKRTNEVCWNGKFYTHQVHIDPVEVTGVEESGQLSLSNPYDINRGIATHEQAVSIIREYIARRETSGAFAEWFSIDPPFPDFPDIGWVITPGNYTNGGIMPLVGGELARACFEHGYEEYAVDILLRYDRLLKDNGNGAYLWYHPDGKPGLSSPATQPCDGWGASAMLYAFLEGLAGVEDASQLFGKVRCSPRWPAAGENSAKVRVGYGPSGGYFSYEYLYDSGADIVEITCRGSGKECLFHVMLPPGKQAVKVTAGGKPEKWETEKVEGSLYVNFSGSVNDTAVVALKGR